MSQKKVFLIGPGFIGREILDLLLSEGYDVTTLARREAAAVEFQKIGVNTRMGDLDNKEVIADQVSKSDIVIHTATADHLPSVQSVIEGIETRVKAGQKTIFIHNSGSGVLDDNSKGDFKSDKVYEDDKPHDIDALPDSAPHRFVDLEIVSARKRFGTNAKIAIIMPPMPTLTRFAIKQKYAGYVGKGAAVWNAVHVFDLARAYLVLLHWLEQSVASEVIKNPYFFCENGKEFSWGEAAAEIGKALHPLGLTHAAEPKSIPESEWEFVFGDKATGTVVGSNSRTRANRLRTFGWQPKEKGLFESLVHCLC